MDKTHNVYKWRVFPRNIHTVVNGQNPDVSGKKRLFPLFNTPYYYYYENNKQE